MLGWHGSAATAGSENFVPHGLVTTLGLEYSYRLAEDPKQKEDATTAFWENYLNKILLRNEWNIYVNSQTHHSGEQTSSDITLSYFEPGGRKIIFTIIESKRVTLPKGIVDLEDQLHRYFAEVFIVNKEANFMYGGTAFGGKIRLWKAGRNGSYIDVWSLWDGYDKEIEHYYDAGDDAQGNEIQVWFEQIIGNRPSLSIDGSEMVLPSITPEGRLKWNEEQGRYYQQEPTGEIVWTPEIRVRYNE
ncbi:MAG: hypothetical protein M1834_005433 [Cirrosporium novae-zelandiae]|nr:MAG: hypothetical protein M1834_005433 [Cirrosporium novae-zelandiae]